MACDIADMEACLPHMAASWGNCRGCFNKPCPGRAPQVQICCSLKIVYFALHLLTFIFWRLFIYQNSRIYTVNQLQYQTSHLSTTMSKIWCIPSLWQWEGMWLVRVHDGQSSSHERETCKYHNMRLCPELTQFQLWPQRSIIARLRVHNDSQAPNRIYTTTVSTTDGSLA